MQSIHFGLWSIREEIIRKESASHQFLAQIVQRGELNRGQTQGLRRFNIFRFVVEEERFGGRDAERLTRIEIDFRVGFRYAQLT